MPNHFEAGKNPVHYDLKAEALTPVPAASSKCAHVTHAGLVIRTL